jgi:hypothetical protein
MQHTTGDIAAGGTLTLKIVAKVNIASNIDNIAQVTAANQSDVDSSPMLGTGSNDGFPAQLVNSATGGGVGTDWNDDESGLRINATAIDLSVKQIAEVSVDGGTTWKNVYDATATFTTGTLIRYAVTLNNARNFDTAANVVVNDVQPTGIGTTSYTIEKLDNVTGIWTATVAYGSYDGTNWAGIAALAAGETVRLTIQGTITDLLHLTNKAEVFAPLTGTQFDVDSIAANGQATAATQAEDDWEQVTPGLATIYGKVLDDANGFNPDKFDAGDTGISGVTVKLYNTTDVRLVAK